MGADGHIRIWRDDEVRAAFPDCDELFAAIPTHYADELDGTTYHHVYWGDGLDCCWSHELDWCVEPYRPQTAEEKAQRYAKLDRVREFVAWLRPRGTHWEVWT